MHVAFVGGRAPVTPERRGAIEKLTVEYAVALVERGHSATIFTVGEAPPESYVADGVSFEVITEPIAKPPSHVLPPIRFGRTLEDAVRRVHRRDPIDVVHAQFYPHLLGFSAPESTRVVVTEHNAHPWRREQQFIENLSALHAARWQADTWIPRVEAWKVFREADRVYSVSDAQGAWMEAAVPSVSSKRRTMYNFVNTETYRPDAQPEGSVDLLDGPTVLYAGRKVPHKGLHRAVEALPKTETSVSLAVLGPIGSGFDDEDGLPTDTESLDPYLRRVLRTAQDLGVEDRLRFVGYVPDADLPAYYATADAVVFPSVLESFGMVPVEAMACGTPPVVHDEPPMTETVVDGETGRRVPVSAAGVADGIEDVLAADMSAAARDHVIKQFSAEPIVSRQMDSYRDLLDR
jgi:glycosyltransferase involved in cell wall biosynthesis